MAALNQAKIISALEQAAAGKKGDFIFSFLQAYGTPKSTVKRLQIGDKQRNVARIAGDIAIAQKIYFHPLQKGEVLQKAFDSILALPVISHHKIRFVMVTDFSTVLAYDGKVEDYTEFDFDDFKTNFEFFLPLTGQYEKAIAYAEHPADVKACEKMGRLYDCIRAINHYEQNDLHALNVFLMQNRLENTVTNLNIQAENLQAAESRISDTDVATEMTEFVSNQIKTQAATAMLAQANSLPRMGLQLLQG